MIDAVQELLVKAMRVVAMDILLYVLLGLLAAIFLFGAMFGGGDNAKTNARLKSAMNRLGTREDADQFLSLLPGYIGALFRGSVRMGEPVAAFTFLEPCVIQKNSCLRDNLYRVLMVTTVAMAVLLLAVGRATGVLIDVWILAVVILLAGSLLTVLAAIIGACSHWDACRTFRNAVYKLDRLLAPDHVLDLSHVVASAPAAPVNYGDQLEFNDRTDPRSRFEPIEPYQAAAVGGNYIDLFDNAHSYVDEPDVFTQLAQTAAAPQSASAQPVPEYDVAATAEQTPGMTENENQVSGESLLNDMSADDEFTAAVDIDDMYRNYGNESYDTEHPMGSAVAYVPEEVSPETQALFDGIDNALANGAPVAELKEYATKLGEERNKPENQTPNKQKMIDNAFATLLRCVPKAGK